MTTHFMLPAQPDHITATVEAMAQRTGDDLADYVIGRAIETGGFFKPADPGNTWDNQSVEITLHGVFGQGADLAEAVRNWTRAARWAMGDPASGSRP